MSGQLQWAREGERFALQGELDQDLLVPLWEARDSVTQGARVLDLTAVSRVDTAGLALLIHLIALMRKQGAEVALEGMSDNLSTLISLYNLPADLIP